jgi:hypothetical protein
MKQKNIFLIFCGSMAFAIASCKKAEQPQQTQQQQPQQQQVKPKPIVVKGFYIGMPMEDVIAQAKEVFGAKYVAVFSSDNEVLRRARRKLCYELGRQ